MQGQLFKKMDCLGWKELTSWLNTNRDRGGRDGRGNRRKSIKNKRSIDTGSDQFHDPVQKTDRERRTGKSTRGGRRRSARSTEDIIVVILIDTQYINTYNIKI